MTLSGTLTLVTADPLTGTSVISGELIPSDAPRTRLSFVRFRAAAPELASVIEAEARKLDHEAKVPLALEWSIENGRATLIKTEPQALAPHAHVHAIVERVERGRLSRDEALFAVAPGQLQAAGSLALAADASSLVARGLAASPGAAVGPLALRASDVTEGCIWVVADLEAEDAPLLTRAAGVVATTGGLTSDAAIMARALRKPCAVSTPIRIEDHASGDVVSLDGASGEVHRGALPMRWSPAHPHARALLEWATERAASNGGPAEILGRVHGQGRSSS